MADDGVRGLLGFAKQQQPMRPEWPLEVLLLPCCCMPAFSRGHPPSTRPAPPCPANLRLELWQQRQRLLQQVLD